MIQNLDISCLCALFVKNVSLQHSCTGDLWRKLLYDVVINTGWYVQNKRSATPQAFSHATSVQPTYTHCVNAPQINTNPQK